MIYLHRATGKEFFVHSLNVQLKINGLIHDGVMFTEHSSDTTLMVQVLSDFDMEYESKDKIIYAHEAVRRRQEAIRREQERQEEVIRNKQSRCTHKWKNSIADNEKGERTIKKTCVKCNLIKLL